MNEGKEGGREGGREEGRGRTLAPPSLRGEGAPRGMLLLASVRCETTEREDSAPIEAW